MRAESEYSWARQAQPHSLGCAYNSVGSKAEPWNHFEANMNSCVQKIGFTCGQMPIHVELRSEQPNVAFRFASGLNRGNVPRLRPSL